MFDTENESIVYEIQEFEEDVWGDTDENLLPTRNFFSEVSEILKTHQIPNTDNAIALNWKMQDMLREMQKTIQGMLNKCKEKYKKNEEYLKNSMNVSLPRKEKRFKSYSSCGVPYFKNNSNYPAPPNYDYLHRRDVENELFPNDITLKKNITWTLMDKINIIKGVKEQAISYLKDSNNAIALSSKNTRTLRDRTIEKNGEINSLLLVDLLQKTNGNFVINWYRISSDNLKYRHSETSCEAMWQMYLRPELNRSQWSSEESLRLEKLIPEYNFSNWSDIAKRIGDRSEYQCYVHYITVIFEKLRVENRKWTKQDDDLLIEAVEKSRMGNLIRWNIVQQYFPHRNKKQLNTRYNYSLDPKIIKGNFTKEEDCVILAAVQQYGENFSTMPIALFPGRNIVQIRNRYKNTLQYINKHKIWSPEDDEKLLNFVKENGKTEWRKLSDQFGYHTRTSCRQRYTTIMKFFKKHPNASINDIPRKFKTIRSDITIDNWHTKIANLESEKNIIIDQNRVKKSKSYIKSLRCLELQYYNFFKYSYDYKFDKKPFSIYNPLFNLNFLTNLLELHINQNLLEDLKKKISPHDYKLLKMLVKLRENENDGKFNMNIRLSPNWSTLLGFRSICIQCASTNKSDIIKYEDDRETENFVAAKEKFKARFNSLFYNTILLSRLNPNTLHIPERFSKNMDLGLKEMQESYIDSDTEEAQYNKLINSDIPKIKYNNKRYEVYDECRTVKRIKKEKINE